MIAFSFLNLRNIWERSKNKYILGNLSRFRLCHGTKWLSCQHFNRKSHIMNILLVSKMKHVAKNNVILKIQDMSKKWRKYNGTVTFRLYFKSSTITCQGQYIYKRPMTSSIQEKNNETSWPWCSGKIEKPLYRIRRRPKIIIFCTQCREKHSCWS